MKPKQLIVSITNKPTLGSYHLPQSTEKGGSPMAAVQGLYHLCQPKVTPNHKNQAQKQ